MEVRGDLRVRDENVRLIDDTDDDRIVHQIGDANESARRRFVTDQSADHLVELSDVDRCVHGRIRSFVRRRAFARRRAERSTRPEQFLGVDGSEEDAI